jgi:hypothetical protein
MITIALLFFSLFWPSQPKPVVCSQADAPRWCNAGIPHDPVGNPPKGGHR